MAKFPDPPTVTLADREFVIPPLPARSIIKFMALVGGMGRIDAKLMSEKQFDDIYSAVYLGVKAADPKLSYDEFLNMPIPFDEITDAMFAIAPMCGVEMKRLTPEELAKKMGELQAEAAAASPTSATTGI